MKTLLILFLTAFLAITTHAQSLVTSSTYESAHVISAGPARLLMLKGYNAKGSAQFIQIHDSPSLTGSSAAEVTTFALSGSGATLAGKYFLFSSPTTDFYGWFKASDSTTQVITVNLGAQTGATLADNYFLMAGGTGLYYAWFQTGTEAGPSVPGYTSVPISVSGTTTNVDCATAAAAAIDALGEMVSTSASNVITITSATAGAVRRPPDPGTSGVSVVLTTAGATTVVGTDPAIPLRTGTSIVVSATSTATACATAGGLALNGVVGFTGTNTTSTITLTNTNAGFVSKAPAAGTSGATVTVTTRGTIITTVPVLTLTVPASSNFDVPIPVSGIPFAHGITVGNSSTGPTLTSGSTDCFFTGLIQ